MKLQKQFHALTWMLMKFLNKIIMDSAFKKTEDLVKHIREYIDVRLNSAKLSVAESK